MDPFFQYQEDPETWARARLFGAPSSTILSYYLGLKGWALGGWEGHVMKIETYRAR